MDIFTLSAKLTLDRGEFDRGVQRAERQGSSLASKLSRGLSSAGKTASKALLAGVSATAGAIAALAKSSVNAFSEYEQLVGGVDTLFKDGADRVLAHAQEAYKTAGVDMNTYMETATSFSAALIQGLEGNYKKAAEITDMAIIDMSDNANKMGTDLASIQNAYQGFAKGNYTMLDNLKLGYGGTRKEMERLLNDASKLSGKKYDLSNLADIYEAIHVIQTELGITGTTAQEASSTIQGSTKMMKSAWENLKVAFVDPNANISDAISNFVESAKIAIQNYIPAFSNAVKGIGAAIREIVPVLSAELPKIVSELLPDLMAGGLSLVMGIVQGIVDNLPLIATAAGQMVDSIVEVFRESDSPVLNLIGDGLAAVKAGFQWVIDNQETVITAVSAIVAAFAVTQIASFAAHLNPITIALGLLAAAATWVAANWETVKTTLVGIWESIKTAIDAAWASASEWFGDVMTAISGAWSAVAGWVEQNVTSKLTALFSGVKSVVDNILGALQKIFGLGDKDINVRVHYVNEGGHEAWGEVDESGGGGTETGFAKGSWNIPYNMTAKLHQGEMVLTRSQARRYRDGERTADVSAMIPAIVSAIREGMQDATVRSFISGHEVTDDVSRNTMRQLKARRFAT